MRFRHLIGPRQRQSCVKEAKVDMRVFNKRVYTVRQNPFRLYILIAMNVYWLKQASFLTCSHNICPTRQIFNIPSVRVRFSQTSMPSF